LHFSSFPPLVQYNTPCTPKVAMGLRLHVLHPLFGLASGLFWVPAACLWLLGLPHGALYHCCACERHDSLLLSLFPSPFNLLFFFILMENFEIFHFLRDQCYIFYNLQYSFCPGHSLFLLTAEIYLSLGKYQTTKKYITHNKTK
jgi:hypothetical protein